MTAATHEYILFVQAFPSQIFQMNITAVTVNNLVVSFVVQLHSFLCRALKFGSYVHHHVCYKPLSSKVNWY